jgi:PAB-dependent poly(A)-specific ribonuclease subunit 2
VSEEGRLGLGRVSIVDSLGAVIMDDYVLPSEPIIDYVTRFSGLCAEDLDPKTTKHSLVSTKTAYLKLRYFIDSKCVIVGHGMFSVID